MYLRKLRRKYSCSGNNICCYFLDLQENKEALNTAMEELKDARDDVKRRVDEAEDNPNEPMKCNQEVNGWLQRVQHIEDEVVKVIDKADQEINRRCLGGYCPKNCWNANKIGKLVIRKLAIVNDLRSKGSFVDVAYKLPPPLVQKEPVDLTVGMESMFDKVWRSLAKDEVRTIGLYGQGGVGKTTLLKQINNEFQKSTRTTHGFDVVIYVVVSNTLNIDAIQKEIGKRLGLSSPDRTSILNTLTKKNFVLLLDDIWERVDLQSIGIPCPENSKSKIIFTTRSETVCGLMEANKILKVQCLPWDEAWTLFQMKVGNEALNSATEELAKVVAKECCGLPLALITIGRAMFSKKTVQEWNRAITTLRKSASKFPGMVDKILRLLRLSYDSLDDETIKSCFLYCSLFPEDHSIDKSKLVDYWIGEGLILLDESDDIDDARNHGYDVIGILKGACMLESGKYKETVKMHDTIRDLGLWIKKDKMLIARASESEHTYETLWCNAERVYYMIRVMSFEIKIAPPKSPSLQTLLFENPFIYSKYSIPHNFFQFMPLLRVLDLSGCMLKVLPTSITELLELQYLNLSKTYIRVIPLELRKLVKLRYLNMSFMIHLTTIPKIPSGVIGSLLELRVLNLCTFKSGEDWDIEEGNKLKYLNDLGIFINTHLNLNKLLSNQNLPKCTRHLILSEVVPQSLSLSPIRTLEKLKLLSNLETLSLRNHNGAELMNDYHNYIEQQRHLGSCFQNLSKIKISNCNALKDLTWVGYMGNLKILYVSFCKQLEEIVVIVDDFGGTGGDEISTMMNNVQDVFKRLESLTVEKLFKLKSICRKALAFPCLEFINVIGCPRLKKLPFDYGSNVNNTLQLIEGSKEWWDELQWEEEGHDNNELKSKFLPHFVDFKKKYE